MKPRVIYHAKIDVPYAVDRCNCSESAMTLCLRASYRSAHKAVVEFTK